ncbi:unnamed protein product [Cunninghamella blakesleeana]
MTPFKANGVYFGQVDCNTNEVLCKEQNVYHNRIKQEEEEINKKWIIHQYIQGEFKKSIKEIEIEQKQSLSNEIEKQIVSSPLGSDASLSIHKLDFLQSIQSSHHPWFIKFYAPWCGHCKKLAPIWDHLAALYSDQDINIGEVNCESNKELCDAEKITGLPTLKFFHYGTSYIYKGDRTAESFIKYLEKMTGPSLTKIDESNLSDVLKNPVSVIHIHQSNNDYLDIIDQSAKTFLDSVPFYTTKDIKVLSRFGLKEKDYSSPITILTKDGGNIYQLMNHQHENNQIVEWVENNKYPIMLRINSGNANEILKGSRLTVMMILPNEPSNADFISLSRQFEKEIRNNNKELLSKVLFAELNGQVWANYAKRVYDVHSQQMPFIVIVDPKNKVYYKEDLNGNHFSPDKPEALFEALQNTHKLEGRITDVPRSISTPQKIVQFIGNNAFLFAIGLLVLFAIFVVIVSNSGDDESVPPKGSENDRNKEKKE